MTEPNEQSALFAALSAAQGAMHHAQKDAQNPHFRSRFASLSSVLDALRQPFAANGLAVVQSPSLSMTGGDKPMTCLVVRTEIVHKDGGHIACELSCGLPDDRPQTIGSAISYLRRYGLMALAGVAAADEDDDGEAVHRPPQQSQARPQQNAPATLHSSVVHPAQGGKPNPQKERAAAAKARLVAVLGEEQTNGIIDAIKAKRGADYAGTLADVEKAADEAEGKL